ncbi:DDT domain-containing protein PTM-like isoform X2 [Vigna umbellata]|uniref:DDT domain-containing protein PTM-like isoform X2 n=1 Tax=Vigna umbellata TaxID=87088 RepID=UPI001F5FCFBB|nr:DDT domain-containing protein PTM-like isoform X2 [Vigna umbellata]
MEPPVVRSRGRPRKRRREEDGTVAGDPKTFPEAKKAPPVALVGRYVLKEFRGNTVLLGKVVRYESGLYRVVYESGGFEDLDSIAIRRILLLDSYFDDDLIRRKGELEESVLPKIAEVRERGSSELHGDLLVESEEERDETDDESCSEARDLSSDSETPIPSAPTLPPSSGTIGVPESCVLNLLSVYGFLRSFSIRLFLSPFTLDEFVGALNCKVSNTLLDAIHISLMRVLRRHLENISPDGSRRATKCLRCIDWSLLDALTWPVFTFQYLAIYGYTKGPEWKGFYNEIFHGEYYLLSASRKLMILQILCDDVLASEEFKAEMNMREESEVGIDYDNEDSLPTEIGPRRVHPRYSKTTACKDSETKKYVSELNAEDVDGNGDECRLCGMDGTLLCCDGCPAVYHSRCIGVMKMHIPDGEWYCPECKINMIGPSIARGTSLKGAEVFGKDLYGQVFMGTCDHLLVLDVNSDEFCLKYYNQNDIPEVLQVLTASEQLRPIYNGICMAMLEYWKIPENFLSICVTSVPKVNLTNSNTDVKLSPMIEEKNQAVSSVKAEYSLTFSNGICSDNLEPSLDASLVTSCGPAPGSRYNTRTTVNLKLCEETAMNSTFSIVNHQFNPKFENSVNKSTAVSPAKCTFVNNQFNNYGHTNDSRLPMNLSLQSKGDQSGFGKCKGSLTKDFMYTGFSYKPQSYINCYMHGDFAASAAANLAVLSSEDSRSEGHVSDNLGKATSGNTYLLAKAFSQTASRFFWPSSEKKLIEVPRERCGWCLSCKALISSKKGCMLNHAALSATKNAMKILSGLAPVRIGEGIIPSIATYVIYMEESLRGLIVGPFISECYRRHWRKQVERATSFSDIKPLLLKLEENIRTIAFCGDWVKLMDDWLAEFSTIQSAAVTLGTTQKGATCGRRKKQLSINKVTAGACPQNFVWWHGGKFSKSVFQKAVLPKTMARKAARQGGSRKISGILYADGSEIPKRSRQVVWRAAVQISRNATQLALQVRYLDFHIRWNDLIRPEHNLLDVKGQDTEASAFRNANIHEKRIVEGKILYRVAFGSQKHLPSRVMKHVEVERGPEGKEKFWFSEKRIPLYLVKEYEMRNGKMLSDKEYMYITSQLHKRQLKATYKDIFFYLTCKRDKLNMLSCSVCQLGVLIGNALKCSACQGYCHTGCSVSSTVSTCEEVEFLATCKQCHHAKLLTQKESCNESPTSPLLLEGQEQSTSAVLKGSGPKCDGQELMSSRTKNSRSDTKRFASDFPLETKGRSRNCSWGIIWKKKNNEDTGFDFRLKNILLKGGSGLPQLEPVCRLCQKPYNSDLMYICCETCKHWYHAEAVELEESRLFDVLGFKCCKCRRIKSPVCPFSDLSYRTQEDKRSSRASKKDYFGGDSDSGTPIDRSTCEPATPICPAVDFSRQDNDPLLFSLSSVELLAEPELDANGVGNTVSGPGLPKISKRERENNGSFRGNLHAEFSTSNEMLSKSVKDLSPSVEDASANCSLLKDPEIVNYHEFVDFEPHTYFSLTELLHSDENIQSEETDASRVFSGCLKNSSCVPEGCGTVNLASNCEPTNLLQGNVYSCQQCSQKEPLPDLHCEICRIWIHRQCSPWVESPSRLASWRCGDCREWR